MYTKQREITLKEGRGGLWFLCSALFLNEIYTPLKFHVPICNSLWDIAPKRLWHPDIRTFGRTNSRTDDAKSISLSFRRGITRVQYIFNILYQYPLAFLLPLLMSFKQFEITMHGSTHMYNSVIESPTREIVWRCMHPNGWLSTMLIINETFVCV